MSGMSASANWSMKSASAAAATTWTPSAAPPGRGLARPAAGVRGRAADDEEPGPARALRIRQARHRHVERVGVGEKNALRGAHRALRGRRGRMVLEDLGDDLTTLGEVVEREPEDLVIRPAQHAAVAVGLRGLAPLGF